MTWTTSTGDSTSFSTSSGDSGSWEKRFGHDHDQRLDSLSDVTFNDPVFENSNTTLDNMVIQDLTSQGWTPTPQSE